MAAALRPCYCGASSAAVVAARKKNSSGSSSRTVIRASSMDGCCSSDESKVGTNPVRVVLTTSSKVNKVYEDRSNGILCYTDCNGELVCEGLDEGPRLTWQDMEKLSKDKKAKAEEEEDLRRRTLAIAGGGGNGTMDWTKLIQAAAVSMGKN